MTKTKILLLAVIFSAVSFSFLLSGANAGTLYEYTIKLLLDKSFVVCCDLSPAQCLSDAGPITPENIGTYYPNETAFLSELELLEWITENPQDTSYTGEISSCLKINKCGLGLCPLDSKLEPTENTCSLKNACADPKQFCLPEIVASNGSNVCVPKYIPNHACLQSFQCDSGSCIKYDYVCAQSCPSTAACVDNQYCEGGACKPKITTGNTCKSNSACLSEICYFGLCDTPAYCSTDADCKTDYYCRTTKTPKLCKEKKYSWESCAKDNECLSGKCLYQKCIIVEDQCKADYNCPSDKYCNIASTPKKCVSKKAAGASCTAGTANQCLSGKCTSGTCEALDECQTSNTCQNEQYCNKSISPFKCDNKKNNDTGCFNNEECISGFCNKIADSGTCETPSENDHECLTNNDCITLNPNENNFCDKSGKVFICIPKKSGGVDCQNDQDCSSGKCSITGQCLKDPFGKNCYDDKDCLSGKKCNLASHLCEEAAPEECEIIGGFFKIECPVDQYCSVGTCVNKKDTDGECEIGGHCKSNFCHPDEKKCMDEPSCGNYATVKKLEYEEECEVGYDPGTTIAYTTVSCVGCKVVPDKVVGCTEDKICGSGYYCDAADVKCKPKLNNADYCTTDNQCKSGYCDTTGVMTGTGSAGCAPKPGEPGKPGEKPTVPIACKTTVPKCSAGYYCDTKNLCQFLKIAGANCTTGGECLSNTCTGSAAGDICGCTANKDCAFGEYCILDPNFPNMCDKLGNAPSNNPCDNQEKCTKGKEYCNLGTGGDKKCKLKKKPGEACLEIYECLSSICANGKCGCISNNECGTGFFCDIGLESEASKASPSNQCIAKYDADVSCADGEDVVCKSGKCENGKCTTPTAEQAGGTQIKSIELPNFLGETDFAVVIGRVIIWIIGLVGSAALAMFLYGGTLWLISRGESEMLKKGRDTMIWAIIGLVIIFTSFILINFILKVLGSTAAQ